MTDGGETMLVAERDGAVVGFASIKGTVLFGLYVDPAKGRGAGRLLLEAVEDEVRRQGATVLSLQATLNAVPFYRKHGFMRQDRSTVRRGGRDLAVLDMTKTVMIASASCPTGARSADCEGPALRVMTARKTRSRD